MQLAREKGYLGPNVGQRKAFDLDVGSARAYVCGEGDRAARKPGRKTRAGSVETALPAIEGLFGKPTVVNNVISLAGAGHSR